MIILDASVADGAGALFLLDRDRITSQQTESRKRYPSRQTTGRGARVALAAMIWYRVSNVPSGHPRFNSRDELVKWL